MLTKIAGVLLLVAGVALAMGILAGILSGAVFVAPMYASVFGLLFINFTHLPLFLAGLG